MSIDTLVSSAFDKRSIETLEQSAASLLVILTTFSGILLARVATQKLCAGSHKRYLVEFVLIAVPAVLFVTVASDYVAPFVALMILLLGIFIFRTRSLKRARRRPQFDLGKRPTALTIVRALTHLITAVCILAIDFSSFHRPYRKSRQFGAQLMDTGIGLFVVTMGLVSRRPRNSAELKRSLLFSTLPLLLLGFARTIVIMTIGYGQDEHEYGRHLNAFFTLGLTKLLGTLLSALARSEAQLLPISVCLLVAHQLGLSGGLSDYVMNDNSRSTLLSANREGLLSLPGFVAIYLISIVFSRWLVSKTLLSYAEMRRKLWTLLAIVFTSWILLVASAFAFGVSRVTCNFGYIVWMLAIIATMLWLSLFIGDFIINTVLPLPLETTADSLEQGAGAVSSRTGVFVICEALNMNGLTFFMLANLLTGGVNIFLKPEDRSDGATVVILLGYMLLATSVVYLLYRKRVRIA